MIAKCANPVCSAPFRYYGEGKLFSFEIKDPSEPCRDLPNAVCLRKPHHHTIFFWLCRGCAPALTLRFDQHRGLSIEPLSLIPGAQDQSGQ